MADRTHRPSSSPCTNGRARKSATEGAVQGSSVSSLPEGFWEATWSAWWMRSSAYSTMRFPASTSAAAVPSSESAPQRGTLSGTYNMDDYMHQRLMEGKQTASQAAGCVTRALKFPRSVCNRGGTTSGGTWRPDSAKRSCRPEAMFPMKQTMRMQDTSFNTTHTRRQ